MEKETVKLPKNLVNTGFAEIVDNVESCLLYTSGKTFLSNCIARESIESGHSVIYFSASSLFDTLSRNAFDYKNQESLD